MGSYTKQILKTYRQILKKDGMVDRETLLEMLRLDDLIPNNQKTEKDYNEMADEILNTKLIEKLEANDRRVKLYKQGLTINQMADKEKVTRAVIVYWLYTNNLQPNYEKRKAE